MTGNENQQKTDEPVLILGAGLAGSLLACFMANQGYKVNVFERRGDMRKTQMSAGRSINLALSVRGIDALSKVGLKDHVMSIAIPMKGRMMHSIDGKLTYQPYSKDEKSAIYSISRGELNSILMTLSEKNPNVNIQFNQKCQNINLESGEATFRDEETKEVKTLKGQTILATDGAFSIARDRMMRTPRFNYSQEYLEHGYKELHIPPGPNGEHQLDKNCLHIWPRGHLMMIALPNLDGSFTVTCFFPFGTEQGFDYLDNASDAEVLKFFQTYFNDVLSVMPSLVEDFKKNPTSTLLTVRCFPWSISDKCCLMGDAAHAIVPFFGQGMNAAFEDCAAFNATIDKFGKNNWGEVFKAFQENRKPNTDAIANMALENFIEMRDKVGDEKFLFRQKVQRILGTHFPDKFLSRYEMVSFSTVPYSETVRRGLVNDKIVTELTEGVDDVEKIDIEKAKQLVDKHLEPLKLS